MAALLILSDELEKLNNQLQSLPNLTGTQGQETMSVSFPASKHSALFRDEGDYLFPNCSDFVLKLKCLRQLILALILLLFIFF